MQERPILNLQSNSSTGGGCAGICPVWNRGRGWRTCHLPWEKSIAFGDKKNDQVEMSGPISMASNEPPTHASDGEGKDNSSPACIPTNEVRPAGEARIRRYNLNANSTFARASETHTVLDAISPKADRGNSFFATCDVVLVIGETSTVVGKRWIFRANISLGGTPKTIARRKYLFRRFPYLSEFIPNYGHV